MNAREYLEKVGELIRDIHYYEAKAGECHRKANEAPGMNLDKDRVQTTPSLEAPFLKWIYKAMDWEEKAKEVATELDGMKEKTAEIIKSEKDIRVQGILFDRYVLVRTWSEIAASAGYSKTHVFRLHDEAMARLSAVELKDES